MKKLLIFAIIIAGCSEEYDTKRLCNPFRMTISDAIPIQFWVNGVETYNQKEVCGITPACFCQPFNCDDEITIQFEDDGDYEYDLALYDSASTQITRIPFNEVSSGVFQLTFTPSDVNICNENIRLEILKTEFQPESEDFTQFGAGLVSWVDNVVNLSSSTGIQSKNRSILFNALQGVTYTVQITLNYTESGTGPETDFFVGFTNNDTVPFDVQDTENYTSNGTYNSTFSLTPTQNTTQFVMYGLLAFIGTPSQSSIEIVSVRINIDDEVVASSDCIDIRESHECTNLIRYTNSKDFADIEYSNFSPNAEFYLRIPSVFAHETNPEESEQFETSGQITVRLRNEIKVKRLLQVGYMPDYMHRKLMLILAHDTVEIDNDTWVKTDAYEKVEPGNKRYPLKMANVLLTLQGYIKRNIL